jgi:RimJ/RimL family protein N-acetyltransferase
MTALAKFAGMSSTRLVFRDFTAADLPAFAQYRNEPEVARYQSWDNYDIDMAKAFFDKQQALPFGEAGSWYQIAIVDKQTNKLVGDCVIHFIDGDDKDQQVEVGFTLAGVNQGKGFAREGMDCLIAFIFNDLNKRRIIAFVDALNKPAAALLEKANFRQEAHLVENILFKGCWGSEFLYALLKREFDAG